MLFEKRFWPLIADGSVTVTYRRWKRPQVVAGRPYRTPGGIVDVVAVEEIDPATITDDDATRAGYPDAATLRAELDRRGQATSASGGPPPVLWIEFRLSERPDPRAVLAADIDLDDEARSAVELRLARLDKASPHGPWTADVLELIDRRPGVRAGDLAAELGRERLRFKADVRKLKALGLTESLPIGYRLSPRGRAYLQSRNRQQSR
jgi:hypothetical protein